ncbi:Non-histone chromosomal protein 6 [Yarrowia lipolytica]|nr:Non-histone chromosomal protein 6 [Yarrowia lipolytica]
MPKDASAPRRTRKTTGKKKKDPTPPSVPCPLTCSSPTITVTPSEPTTLVSPLARLVRLSVRSGRLSLMLRRSLTRRRLLPIRSDTRTKRLPTRPTPPSSTRRSNLPLIE